MKDPRVQYLRDALEGEFDGMYIEYETAQRIIQHIDESVAFAAPRPIAAPPAPSVADAKPCTCHPDDNPPVPCAKQYALNECRSVADGDKE